MPGVEQPGEDHRAERPHRTTTRRSTQPFQASRHPEKHPVLAPPKERNLHIEKLAEGVYLATSDDVQGLVAQGRAITETLEIARDVAKKILEARTEREDVAELRQAEDSFDYPLIVGS